MPSDFDPRADILAPRRPSTVGMTIDELYDAIAARGGSPILILPDLKGGSIKRPPNYPKRVVATLLEVLARQMRVEARRDRKHKPKDGR